MLLGTALLAVKLLAQVTSSDILGTVCDASDAVLPDAHVAVKQIEKNAIREEVYRSNAPTTGLGSRNSLFANVGPDNTAGNCYNFPACLGNAGRNILRADGIGNLDFSAFKRIATRERHNIEFRAEFYNLTNTRSFGIPESRVNSANFANQWGTDGGNRRIQLGSPLRLVARLTQ
jgi:hypothetical protein